MVMLVLRQRRRENEEGWEGVRGLMRGMEMHSERGEGWKLGFHDTIG
jgi:hypothetical protein